MDSKFKLNEIDAVAANVLATLQRPAVLAFHGEMGAGKTTFISALCKALRVTDAVSSPTYAIINQYKTTGGSMVYHMDLYRLKDEEEALMAGVEECYYSGNWCLVEWPEKAEGLLPADAIHCYLSLAGDNERKLQIKM
ncbi:MAG: tRNA (adenosine(37)-N6)-threonylcarbamoyltransferase complex ATPase subunit type 1 TsaE [Chitinophagaceae bacterium]|nr:MAG: tRNA (adenosine(37)-N6)-threonylcarbamoyltransferase complex ATPase subunit type 1 TsaE [Chitinophagaceae bacterium]